MGGRCNAAASHRRIARPPRTAPPPRSAARHGGRILRARDGVPYTGTDTTIDGTHVTFTERLNTLPPRAGVRVQLAAASLMWAIGASILLFRGVGYLSDRIWHAWALAAGLALGMLKARVLLDRVARKAVERIRARGTANFFGFFSVRSWLLIVIMMGGGILLRSLIVKPDVVGAGILGAVYIGVGTALVLADRIFWRALIKGDVTETDRT